MRDVHVPNAIWRCPKIGVHLVIIHLQMGFSLINHPFGAGSTTGDVAVVLMKNRVVGNLGDAVSGALKGMFMAQSDW